MSTSWKASAWRSSWRSGTVLVALILAACSGGESSGPGPTPPPPVSAVAVTPGTASLLEGEQVVLRATPQDASGSPLERAVTWASENSAVATVSATGAVTGIAQGRVFVTATSEGKVGTAVIDVARVPVAEVRLSVEEEVVLPWNGATRLTAFAIDAAGNVLVGRTVTWQSSRPHVVTVDDDGTLQARGAGTAIIGATVEGKHANVGARVLSVPVSRITLEGDLAAMEVGESVLVRALLEGLNGAPVTRSVTWTSSDPSVARVEGRQPALAAVRAVAAGRVTITASAEDKRASISFTVTPPPTHDLLYTVWNGAGFADLSLLGLSATPAPPVRLNAGEVSREPSASPDGSRIVFARSSVDPLSGARKEDLYLLQRDGTALRRLTNLSGTVHQPSWSPDGGRIVFRHIDAVTQRSHLWVVHPDGSGLRKLTEGVPPAMSNTREPAWSPDGSRIAFVAAVGGQHKLWVIDLNGANLRQVTTDAGFDSNPTWSPAGDVIAFTRWNVGEPSMGEDVMLVSLATGVTRRLALPGNQREPAWSPDGHYIAVSGTGVSGAGPQDLYTMRPDGTGLRLRTVNAGWQGGVNPTWIRR